MAIWNSYGLLNSKEADETAENTVLWTLQHILRGGPVDDPARCTVERTISYIIKCLSTDNWFNQFPEDVPIMVEEDRWMSPDQIISMACAYKYIKDSDKAARLFAEKLKKHWLTYDNVAQCTNFKRLMQPTAVLTVFTITGSFWAKFALKQALRLSWRYSSDSGKLKAWTIDRALGLGMFGVEDADEIFIRYFNKSTVVHPTVKLIKG